MVATQKSHIKLPHRRWLFVAIGVAICIISVTISAHFKPFAGHSSVKPSPNNGAFTPHFGASLAPPAFLYTVVNAVHDSCYLRAVHAQASRQEIATRQVDLTHYIFPAFGYDAAVLGLLDRNTLLTARYGFNGQSTIDFWNTRTGQLSTQIRPPTAITSTSLAVSSDGKWLLATQNVITNPPHPELFPHKILLWNLQTRQLTKIIDIGQGNEVNRAFFMSDALHRLIATEHTPPGGTNNPRFVFVNPQTGHLGQTVQFKRAAFVDGLATSPDNKLMLGLYPPDESQPSGSFDVFDAKTLKLSSHFDGDEQGHIVDKPVFFISRTTVVLGNTLYNTATRKAGSVLPNHSGLHGRCLAAVPGRSGYALFIIQEGKAETDLELWNVINNRVVKHWPIPRRPRLPPLSKGDKSDPTEAAGVVNAYVSRDGKAFAFLGDRGIVHVYDYDFNALPNAERGR